MGMDAIARRSTLRLLFFDQVKISDDGLRRLTPLGRLETLDISSTDVTDAGFESLAAFPRFSNPPGLRGMEGLKTLTLRNDRLTVEALAPLSSLTRLDLAKNPPTGSACEIISA